MNDPSLLDYYARRAQEYEQIYQKPERQTELALLKAYLIELLDGHDVLEVACGTGYWTAHFAPFTRSILAIDAAPDVFDVDGPRRTRRGACGSSRPTPSCCLPSRAPSTPGLPGSGGLTFPKTNEPIF